MNYLRGRVVLTGKNRTKETLANFFTGMTNEQRQKIEPIAMDMGELYIHAVKNHVPYAKILFDLFHVVSSFGKVIDKIRRG